MDKISKWVIKIGNWEYDKEKPKRKYIDIDYIADMLIDDFGIDTNHIEAYTELITFAYVNDNGDSINTDNIKTDDIKSYINVNGGINKIIESYKLK